MERSKLNILFFAPRECWPPNTGAKLRNYHLAREVAQSAHVTYLSFADDGNSAAGGVTPSRPAEPQTGMAQPAGELVPIEPAPEPFLARPELLYDRVITVPRDRSYTFGKILRGAVGDTPLTVLNYTTRAMAQTLAQVLEERSFDLIQVESIHLAAYLPTLRAASSRPVVICDWHNIESELMRRYSTQAPNFLYRLYARRTSRQLELLERRAGQEFDAHLTVSERDRAQLLDHSPGARVFVIENGVDASYYSDEPLRRAHNAWLAQTRKAGKTIDPPGDSSGDAPQRRRVVFVGSMDYHANVDAAVHFTREVWPHLRERVPGLTFAIVGRDPAPRVRLLAEIPGVEVTGTVDDVRPFYSEAVAAVIPLRVGGGSRLKILEAMAAGVPVISTRLGAEGLDVRDGEDIILAETADDFCRATLRLMADTRQWRKLAEAGRAHVRANYDWSRLGALLVGNYRGLIANRPE